MTTTNKSHWRNSYLVRLVRIAQLLTLFSWLIAPRFASAQDQNPAEASQPSTNDRANEDKSPSKYRSVTSTQLYETDSEMWLMFDIESRTVRSGYAEPPILSQPQEFRAFRILPTGRISEWRSNDPAISAHENLAYLLRRGSSTYLSDYISFGLFKLDDHDSEPGVPVAVPLDGEFKRLKELDVKETIDFLEEENKTAGLTRIAPDTPSFPRFPPWDNDYVSEALNIRLRFVQRPYRLGWEKASVIFERPTETKELVLLDLIPDNTNVAADGK